MCTDSPTFWLLSSVIEGKVNGRHCSDTSDEYFLWNRCSSYFDPKHFVHLVNEWTRLSWHVSVFFFFLSLDFLSPAVLSSTSSSLN